MAKNKPVWGIDLGQCALKAICLRAAGDKVEAVDYVYIEHGKILSQPGVDRAELVTESMKKFLDKHDLSKETLVVGVPGQNTLARFSKLPPVDKRKIPDIVKYEAQQQIPFDMEEVIWDYQTFQGPDAMETEVGIFAMRRDLMREHLKYLSDLRLEPALVQSAPLALYNALKYDGLCGSEPVAILDIGTQNTDLIAIDGSSLWTRNIPIGGNLFTEVLSKTFKLSFNKAENLKRSAGSSKYARQVFQAMRPAFADLVAEVQRSIGFYTSSRRGVKLNKLIAMGNAFRLPGMPKFIQQNVGLEVVRPTTFNRLSASGAPNAPQLMDQLLSFGVAYGLALQGLGLAQITSNLLPPEVAKQVVWQKKTPWFYGAVACLVASAGLIWLFNYMDSRAVAAGTGEGQSGSHVVTTQMASQIVDNDPPAGLAPKPYAQEVLEAGRYLGNDKSKAEGEIQKYLTEADDKQKLQVYKAVWPKILKAVHAALPVEAKINQAMQEGPEAFKALIAGDPAKYERSKRKQIFIQRLEAEYTADIVAKLPSGGAAAGSTGTDRRTTATDQGGPQSGFILTLTCQTPYAAGDLQAIYSFLQKEFIARLRKEGQQEKGIYFEKVDLSQVSTLKDLGAKVTGSSTVSGYNVTPSLKGGVEESKDPVTNEPIGKDWQFYVTIGVVLGDRPAAPTGGAAGPTPQE